MKIWKFISKVAQSIQKLNRPFETVKDLHFIACLDLVITSVKYRFYKSHNERLVSNEPLLYMANSVENLCETILVLNFVVEAATWFKT